MKVQMDPAQMRELGVTEDVSIDLPDEWGRYTKEQRIAWCRHALAVEGENMLRELGLTEAEIAAQREAMYAKIDQTLAGLGVHHAQ